MQTIPIPTCHHIFPDAHRCGSPSIRNQAFCYFHHPDRQPVLKAPKPTPPRPRKRSANARKYPGCKHLHCPFRRATEILYPITPMP